MSQNRHRLIDPMITTIPVTNGEPRIIFLHNAIMQMLLLDILTETEVKELFDRIETWNKEYQQGEKNGS